MAVTSKLTIFFDGNPVALDYVEFTVRKKSDPTQFKRHIMTWSDYNPRIGQYYVPTTISTIGVPGEASASLYWYYLNVDYPNFPGYITRTEGEVVITVNEDDQWDFDTIVTDSAFISAVAVNSVNIPVTLVSAALSGGANPCTDISLSIEASEVLPTVRINGVFKTEENTSNPYITTFKRGIDFSLYLSKAGELQVALSYPEQYYLIVPTFGVDDINVQINNSLSGATVIVTVTTIEHQRNVPLVFEYSLDNGVNWVSQNVFTGQTAGTYTIQVRDQFGCQHSQDYIVLAFNQREPYLFVSKTNSISFAKSEDFDYQNVFPTDENTLAHQSLTNTKFCDPILFNKSDSPRIQFKSNYGEVKVKLRKEDLTELEIPVVQVSSNLDRFMSLDCLFYKYSDTRVAIYFESGNTYDKIGAIIPDKEHALKGNLPNFGFKGMFIELGNHGTFEILDVLFDSNTNKKVLIIEFVFSGDYDNSGLSADIATSVFDMLPFEVYEFILDFTLLQLETGLYDVLIENETIHPTDVTVIGTNLLVWSNDLDEFQWVKTNTLPFLNNKLRSEITATPQYHFIHQRVLIDGTPKEYTFSCYAKKDELIGVSLVMENSVGNAIAYAYFNLDNGTILFGGRDPRGYRGFVMKSYKITPELDGYYRCSITVETNDSTYIDCKLTMLDSWNSAYIGDGVSGVFVKNFQVQQSDLTIYTESTNVLGVITEPQILSSVKHLSENIYITDNHEETVHIRYYNENNRDIFYKYGIEHTIRVPYLHIKPMMNDESSISIGDLTSTMTESKVHELNEFMFVDLVNSAMRKLAIALSCEKVFINGEGYVKNEGLSIENIPNSNLHTLLAIMLKTNINYNNNNGGQTGINVDESDLNIPAFIISENGFIKS